MFSGQRVLSDNTRQRFKSMRFAGSTEREVASQTRALPGRSGNV
jgi:hypothetical protein